MTAVTVHLFSAIAKLYWLVTKAQESSYNSRSGGSWTATS